MCFSTVTLISICLLIAYFYPLWYQQDTLVQGCIPAVHQRQFRERLSEGSVYTLSGFDVTRSSPKFKLTDGPISIRFNEGTAFDKVAATARTIPTEHFRFRMHQQILELANSGRQLLGASLCYNCLFLILMWNYWVAAACITSRKYPWRSAAWSYCTRNRCQSWPDLQWCFYIWCFYSQACTIDQRTTLLMIMLQRKPVWNESTSKLKQTQLLFQIMLYYLFLFV